jgi:hypothetical protein
MDYYNLFNILGVGALNSPPYMANRLFEYPNEMEFYGIKDGQD